VEAQAQASAAKQALHVHMQHRPPLAEGLSNYGVIIAAAHNGLLQPEHTSAVADFASSSRELGNLQGRGEALARAHSVECGAEASQPHSMFLQAMQVAHMRVP